MALRRPKGEETGGERWLEVDASMTGTLSFRDPVNLQINGTFEGTLDTKGTLAIGERAHVKATIKGESISIAGSVDGDVTATNRVELTATARMTGKVVTPRVSMEDGAVFNGSLEMSRAESGGLWMTVEELVRYLEVDADTVTKWAQSGRLPARRTGDRWQFERARIEEWVAQEKIK